MFNLSKPSSTGLAASAVSISKQLLRSVSADTTNLVYATLDLNRCLPVITGFRGLNPVCAGALPAASAETDNGLIISCIRTILVEHQCDAVAVAYPVWIEPSDSRKYVDLPPELGLLIDVQVKGQPGAKGLVPVVKRIGKRNVFGPTLPLPNREYSIAYQGLFEPDGA